MSPEAAIALLRDRTASISHAQSEEIARCIVDLCEQIHELLQISMFEAEQSGAPARGDGPAP